MCACVQCDRSELCVLVFNVTEVNCVLVFNVTEVNYVCLCSM